VPEKWRNVCGIKFNNTLKVVREAHSSKLKAQSKSMIKQKIQIAAGSHSHFFSKPIEGLSTNAQYNWWERHLAAILSI